MPCMQAPILAHIFDLVGFCCGDSSAGVLEFAPKSLSVGWLSAVSAFKLTGSPNIVMFSCADSFNVLYCLLFCCVRVPLGPCLWLSLESGIDRVDWGTSRSFSPGLVSEVSALSEVGSPSLDRLSSAECLRLFCCILLPLGLSFGAMVKSRITWEADVVWSRQLTCLRNIKEDRQLMLTPQHLIQRSRHMNAEA